MLNLISDRLVELVEKHADIIIKRWITSLLADESTASFTSQNIKFVERKARDLLKSLGQWISYETSKEEVGKRYGKEGMDLFEMGIPLCEVHRANVVLRRTLWIFVVNESPFESAFQLHQMRELNDRVVLFFDRAEYYTIRGYVEAMHRKSKELLNASDEKLDAIFIENSFYKKG
jgi:hypothetical protein